MADSVKARDSWIALLVGLAIFVTFTGGKIVAPTNVDWIMAAGGDPIQHYIGWNFFRHGDLLQFPIGLNKQYGEQISSSIVFSDSIPLLALPFKYVRAILPDQFQYFGLWIASCFALQAFFGWRILALFTRNRAALAVGSALLTLSPPMLWRLLGHEALVGHWIVLAGLYLYLRKGGGGFQWTLLLCIAALVHPYLLAMSLGIWAADRCRALIEGETRGRSLLLETGLAFVSLAIVMFSAGYFAVRGVGSEGYGYYRFNMTSPLHPLDIWSIWRQTPYVGGNYEGFSYPGAGMFVLALIVLVLVTTRWKHLQLAWRPAVPLIAACAVFYLYALSNRVALGPYELIQFEVPRIFESIVSAFRSTGRFIWPVLYAIEILLLVMLLKLAPRRLLGPALGVVLLLQATDLLNAAKFFRSRWDQQWNTPLVSDFWDHVPGQYRRIAFVLPLDGGERYAPIAFLASNAGMSINGGYFARVDFDKLKAVEDDLLRVIETNAYRNDTLYVFNKETHWRTARARFSGNGFIGYVDGYRVVAPAWTGCVDACTYRDEIARIDFTDGHSSDPYLMTGWSTPGQGGRWTDGRSAALVVPLAADRVTALSLRMRFQPYIKPAQERQRVVVRLNGKVVAQWQFTKDQVETRELALPLTDIQPPPVPRLHIQFDFPDARSPRELGISDDTRLLGIHVEAMEILAR